MVSWSRIACSIIAEQLNPTNPIKIVKKLKKRSPLPCRAITGCHYDYTVNLRLLGDCEKLFQTISMVEERPEYQVSVNKTASQHFRKIEAGCVGVANREPDYHRPDYYYFTAMYLSGPIWNLAQRPEHSYIHDACVLLVGVKAGFSQDLKMDFIQYLNTKCYISKGIWVIFVSDGEVSGVEEVKTQDDSCYHYTLNFSDLSQTGDLLKKLAILTSQRS